MTRKVNVRESSNIAIHIFFLTSSQWSQGNFIESNKNLVQHLVGLSYLALDFIFFIILILVISILDY